MNTPTPIRLLRANDVDAFAAEVAVKIVEVSEGRAEGPFGRAAYVEDLQSDVITIASRAGWAFFGR